jgi:hypothetical protein
MHCDEDKMTLSNRNTAATLGRFFAGFALILAVTGCETPASTTPPVPPPAKPAAQESFATPDEAVDAIVAAARTDNKATLVKILGPHAEKIIHSGDKVADREAREKFLAAYDKKHALDIDEDDNDRASLVVGSEEWPMPIPLVRTGQGWWFDTAAGEEEILNRRIGRNELNVIEVCRAYVDAQREFAAQHKLGDHKHEYAQRFTSTSGQHDGLYWETKDGEAESPLGPLIASATAEGYKEKTLSKHTPYHGYFYKILTKQGPHSPMGAKDYIKDGHMTRGFALVAFPDRYGDSGVMTFIVNRHGIVFQKNLGPDTAKIAAGITEFDPDEGWSVVQ